MSQLGKLLYGGMAATSAATTIQTDSGVAKSSDGTINAIGGDHLVTSASGNSVTVETNDYNIPFDSITAGNIKIFDSNKVISTNVNGNIVLNTATKRLSYADGKVGADGAQQFFNAERGLEGVLLTDGQVLIGRTGANPLGAHLTAGPGISIENGYGQITINSTSNNFSSNLTWMYLNYAANFTVSTGMLRNYGYIITKQGVDGSHPLTLTLPGAFELEIGDVVIVSVIAAYGTPSDPLSNVYIDPGVNSEIVATGQSYSSTGVARGPVVITSKIRPITKNGGMPTITLLYTGNTNNISGSTKRQWQVVQSIGNWRWDTLS